MLAFLRCAGKWARTSWRGRATIAESAPAGHHCEGKVDLLEINLVAMCAPLRRLGERRISIKSDGAAFVTMNASIAWSVGRMRILLDVCASRDLHSIAIVLLCPTWVVGFFEILSAMQKNERGETDTQGCYPRKGFTVECSPAAMIAYHVEAEVAQRRRRVGVRKLSFFCLIEEDNESLHYSSQNV